LRVVVTRAAVDPPLTAALDQAAYRILQEALTNAARHGTGTAAVELRAGDDALEVSVTNPIAPNRDARPTRGHGLIGMRERVNLLGGQFRATADHDRFVVSARLPYAGRP
jgi:signal transduction histidine kinase